MQDLSLGSNVVAITVVVPAAGGGAAAAAAVASETVAEGVAVGVSVR